MTFKWKISAPARVQRAEGVELHMAGVECDFETGSAAEAVGIFEEEDTAFTKIFGFSPMSRIEFGASTTNESAEAGGATETQPVAAGGKKRGPKPKAAPDVVAPDPILVVDPSTVAAAPAGPAVAAPSSAPVAAPPIPSSAPAVDTTPGSNGVPAFLDRTAAVGPVDMTAKIAAAAAAASPAPPPPPPLPTVTAPPIAAAAPPPPVGVLGPKVVKALDERKKLGSDDGQALADWLAQTGLTIKGANYDSACRAVLMISDEKITAAGILAPLGIAA